MQGDRKQLCLLFRFDDAECDRFIPMTDDDTDNVGASMAYVRVGISTNSVVSRPCVMINVGGKKK